MSSEKICLKDYQKFQKNHKSNTENQSISNALSRSDLRNKLNKNKGKSDFDNIVIECQSGEIDETEYRIGEIQIGNKQVFTSDDLEVYKEYVQWDFINNKLYVKCDNVLKIVDNRRKQEFKNTLKSWFNLINKDFKEVVKYEYYPILPNIPVEHVAAQFLRKELIAKQFVTEKDANDKIREILRFISTNHSGVPPLIVAGPMNVEYDKDRNILIVNKFQSLKAPRDKLLSDRNEIISTAKLLLREESLGEFHDKLIRSAVECQQQQQQEQRARVNSGLEWRNRENNNNNRNRNCNNNQLRLASSSSSSLLGGHLSLSQVANEEGQSQLQQQSARVNSGLEQRNPHRYNNNNNRNNNNNHNRQNNEEKKRKIDNHQSEWRNRYSNNSEEEERSSGKAILSRSAVEWQQQEEQEKQRARVNNESEWRNPPPRYNNNNNRNNNNEEKNNKWRNRQNNEEKKRKIDDSYKYSERNGKTVNESDLVDIHQSEWRNPPPPRYNNNSNNRNNNRNNRTDNNNNKPERRLSSSSSSSSSSQVSNKEGQCQSIRVDNHQSEQRNPPPRHNNNNSNNNQSVKKSSDKVIKSSRDIDLYKEYVQWDFINNELYVTGELLLNVANKRERQEFTNTLQRWFIFINEDYNEVPKYEYFTILPNIPLEHPAAQFLRDAIIEKEFANEDDADWKMRKILGFISNNHSQVVPHEYADPLHVEHDPDRKIVVVNKFQSAEVPRVNLLVEKGGVIAAARMLLRYESFGNGSYQWGDPEEVHKVLHDKFNVRYEGFASPVNSRFIEYNDTHFCSLFPETDEPFGSIGNFFHVDMEKHAGGWSVNPPFLNDLMKNVADRINEILDAGHKCYFFCTFPWWEDDEGWNILNDSPHFNKRFDLLPQHFKVQDAYGNKFEPKMKMNIFVMGELPSTVPKLIELGQELIINREDIKDHDIRVELDENYKNCPW